MSDRGDAQDTHIASAKLELKQSVQATFHIHLNMHIPSSAQWLSKKRCVTLFFLQTAPDWSDTAAVSLHVPSVQLAWPHRVQSSRADPHSSGCSHSCSTHTIQPDASTETSSTACITSDLDTITYTQLTRCNYTHISQLQANTHTACNTTNPLIDSFT